MVDPNVQLMITQNKTHLWNFFKQNGGAMILDYFTALLLVPPRDVAEVFVDAIGDLCVTFIEEE